MKRGVMGLSCTGMMSIIVNDKVYGNVQDKCSK